MSASSETPYFQAIEAIADFVEAGTARGDVQADVLLAYFCDNVRKRLEERRKNMSTTYVGTVHCGGPHQSWTVETDNGDRLRPLHPCLDVVQHSPMGFSWGYEGSGAAQLALAILADAIGVQRALPLYQQFKRDEIAPIPLHSCFRMAREDVLAWVDSHDREAAR